MIAKMRQIDGTWKYDYTVFDRWVQFMMDLGIDKQIDCYTLVPWHYVFDYYDCATNSTKQVKCEPKQQAYRELILPFPPQGQGMVRSYMHRNGRTSYGPAAGSMGSGA